MNVLTAFAAITSCRFTDARRQALRQEDSGAQTLLLGDTESACLPATTNAPSALPPNLPRGELPGEVDALRALILAERAVHAAAVQERDAGR